MVHINRPSRLTLLASRRPPSHFPRTDIVGEEGLEIEIIQIEFPINPSQRRVAATQGREMQTKTRFTIQVPGGTTVGCDTAEQVLDALNDLKNAEGVTVTDLQTGMGGLTREALEELANGERE
jgi:hypothetical protein